MFTQLFIFEARMTNRNRLLHPDHWVEILVAVISILLVALNVTRIITVPLTFDEAAPYANVVRPYRDIIAFKTVSSNDHLLNSLLRKFFVEIGSDTPFWRRFDSLLAQLMFLGYAYALCKRLFTNRSWQVCVFLLLNLHPFLFEFWGLSRGYGLAIAFMTASVYHLVRYSDDKKTVQLNLSLYLAIIAVYANFTLLDYYCGLVACIFIAQLIPASDRKLKTVLLKKEIIFTALASAVLYLLVAGPIRKLIAAHQLYYGGTHNIIVDTITSVVYENLFSMNTPGAGVYILATAMMAIAIIMGVYWFIRCAGKQADEKTETGIRLWVLLTAPAIAITAQHILFNTLYPIDRTALFFIPLYVLALCYWLYYTGRKSVLILYLLTVLIAFNFLKHVNISTTRKWWFGSTDLVVLNRIVDETKTGKRKNKLCVYWLFNPTFNYYINSKYEKYFEPIYVPTDCPTSNDTTFDYYYIPGNCLSSIPKMYITDTSLCGNAFYLMRKSNTH